ncbi:MAG: hypothetical protein ACRES9_00140 [Gammaproteobacteria bacterium]
MRQHSLAEAGFEKFRKPTSQERVLGETAHIGNASRAKRTHPGLTVSYSLRA